MKRKLINLLTIILAIVLLVPFFGVSNVNADTKRVKEFYDYFKRQGRFIVSADNQTACTDYNDGLITFENIYTIIPGKYDALVMFDYSITEEKIIGDVVTYEVIDTKTRTIYKVFYRELNLNYTPSSKATINDSNYAYGLTSNDYTTLRNDFINRLPKVMNEFDKLLMKNGFTLGNLGFTYSGYQHSNLSTPAFKIDYSSTSASDETFTDTNNLYNNICVSGAANLVTYKLYYNSKLIASDEGTVCLVHIYSDKQLGVSNTAGKTRAIDLAPYRGSNNIFYLPEGTYKIEYYYNGKVILSKSQNVYNSDLHPSLPAFTPSVGGSGIDGFVTRLYKVVLGRNPDSAGKTDWINKLKSKTITGGTAATKFLTSTEFTSKKYLDKDFIEILYRTFFNRNSDESGRSYWLNKLTSGTSRTDVIKSFINSNEWATICAQYGIASGGTGKVTPSKATTDFVTRLYTKCLGRNASTSDVDYWAQKLATKELSGSQVAQKFFFGSEFTGKKYSNEEFVKRLYRTCMNREPSSSDVTYWVNKLKSGTSRQALFNSFVSKPEFVNLCKNAGINP